MIAYANDDDVALEVRMVRVLVVVAKRRKQMSHLHFDLYCRVVVAVEIVVVADVARFVDFCQRILVQKSGDC